MEGLADRSAIPWSRGMIGDHQRTAGLERRVELAVHLSTIDGHVSGVVIEEEKGDEVEIAHVRGQRIVEGTRQAHDVLARRRIFPCFEPGLCPLAYVGRVLSVDYTGWDDRAGHEFRAVPAAGTHIEDLHTWTYTGEDKERRRVAPFVGLPVRIGTIGCSDDHRVVGCVALGHRAGSAADVAGEQGGKC
jgi:hypothetical protein